MRILVIDGQGGRIGRGLIEALLEKHPDCELVAVGTNAIATSTMVKAGAAMSATGENPVIVNAETADYIMGPIGIIAANSLLGEITPAMALAVSKSRAKKILIPMSRCNVIVAGTQTLPISEHIALAVEEIGK